MFNNSDAITFNGSNRSLYILQKKIAIEIDELYNQQKGTLILTDHILYSDLISNNKE